MRKPIKSLGIIAAVLLLLAGIGLLSLNLFLRSPGMKARVTAAVQRRTLMPCRFESISYLPFQGLKLSEVRIEQNKASASLTDVPFFHANAMVARISLWSLIRRPIMLEEVRCIRPTIVTVQLDNGSMSLPWPSRPPVQAPVLAVNTPSPIQDPEVEMPPTVKPSDPTKTDLVVVQGSGESSTPAPVAQATKPPAIASHLPVAKPDPPVAPPTPSKPTTPGAVSSMPQSLWIKAARVLNGRFVVLASDGQRPLIELNNIETDLGFDRPWQRGQALPRPSGRLTIEEVRALKVLQMTEVTSSIEFNDGQVTLPDLNASSDGGKIQGKFALGLRGRGLPFKGALDMKNVGLREMIKRVSSRLEFSSGTVHGQIVAQGQLTDPSSWRGVGKIQGLDAKVARHGLLESFGRYLGVQEFVQIAFETAKTEFELFGPALVFRDIHLKTDNLEFKGLGAISMNQRIQLRSRLYFSERMKQVLQRIERQLPERIKRDFEQLEGRDDYYRDFHINGSLNSPRADFIGTQERSLEEMLELMQESSKDDA